MSGLDLESQECVYSVLWHKGLKDTAPLSGYKLSVCPKSLLIVLSSDSYDGTD